MEKVLYFLALILFSEAWDLNNVSNICESMKIRVLPCLTVGGRPNDRGGLDKFV